MKTAVRVPWLLIVIMLLAIAATVLLFLHREKKAVEEEIPVDPHEGQVYIYDGFNWVWMTPLEGVEPNDFTAEDFTVQGTRPVYAGSDYTALTGVDVSEHQYEINWNQVANAGVDYAYIRIGRRGYSEGGLFEDPWFQRNINGAHSAGLKVGVYFFSQAVNIQEAIEEANFVIEHLRGYTVDLPIVYDWEHMDAVEEARTKGLDPDILTDCAVAFCETVKNEGYSPAVYFNRKLGYHGYDLRRLTDYQFWFALYESGFPNFYYKVDMWQFSNTETVPGIRDTVDMNHLYIPR